MAKRILISAGGTGGHVYPAQALAKKLKAENPELYIFFAAAGLEGNQFFDRESFPYQEVSAGYFPLKRPLKCMASFGKLMAGLWQSDRLLKKIAPDLIIGFGSYHTLPLLLAARLRNIPYVLHEANSIPGKVNKLMSKGALATGILFPDARNYLKGNVVEVDLPLRDTLNNSFMTREKAIEHYGLDPDKTTLLFFGGSQGAASLNHLALETVSNLKEWRKNIQILHFTGREKESSKIAHLYNDLKLTAYVKDYEENMEFAWMAGDLLISRSGAGTIAEEIAYEKPGLLIPYPMAADNHQEMNAFFMRDKVKGALTLLEKNLTGKKLASVIISLLEDNNKALLQLRDHIIQFKTNTVRKDFCEFIKATCNGFKERS